VLRVDDDAIADGDVAAIGSNRVHDADDLVTLNAWKVLLRVSAIEDV